MKCIIAIILLISISINSFGYGYMRMPPPIRIWVVSPIGTGTTTCTILVPCDLRALLQSGTSLVVSGDIIQLRGNAGIYKGKYLSNLIGTSGNEILVTSYPNERAKIDGYSTTTLSSSIVQVDSNHSRLHLTANPGLVSDGGPNSLITSFHIIDQSDPSNDEAFDVDTVEASNSYLVVGLASLSHSIGALVGTSGNTLTITGHDVIYKNIEIMNSDPARVQVPLNSQNCPHKRGEGVFLAGKNKLINLILHDNQEGIFSSPAAAGSTVYGCIIFNNGCVNGGVRNGHGTYNQNNDAANPFTIAEDIIFNNFATGVKGESQNANTIGINIVGVVSFNSGPYEVDSNQRRGDILLGANNGTADAVNVDTCFMYDPPNSFGGAGGIGPFTENTGTGSYVNNYSASGSGTGFSGVPNSVTFTGNTVIKFAGGSYIMSVDNTIAASTINNNTYHNLSGVSNVFTKQFVANYNFSDWKLNTGYDASSSYDTITPTTTVISIRPNTYESGRANIIIYNWSNGTTASINLSTTGLINGQAFKIINPVDYVNSIDSPVYSGIYNSSSPTITLPLNTAVATAVATPIGYSQTANTMLPQFGVFVVIPLNVNSICKWDTNPTCN